MLLPAVVELQWPSAFDTLAGTYTLLILELLQCNQTDNDTPLTSAQRKSRRIQTLNITLGNSTLRKPPADTATTHNNCTPPSAEHLPSVGNAQVTSRQMAEDETEAERELAPALIRL